MADLNRQFAIQHIEASDDWRLLRELRIDLQAKYADQIPYGPIIDIMTSINDMHDALIRKAVQLAELELKREGQGDPPVPYAFLLFGSGGRREQTFWSDQDNGIIYDDSQAIGEKARSAVETYFEQLARKIRSGLERLGYPPCEGQVICTNRRWRLSFQQYKHMLEKWFESLNVENVRYMLIMSDARAVYGQAELSGKLRERVLQLVADHPEVMRTIVEISLRHKVLLGPFGNLLLERYGEHAGSIDIKYGSYIPMVNGIRALAIHEAVNETNTLQRLRALGFKGSVPEELLERWQAAFEHNLLLRLTCGKDDGIGKLNIRQCSKEEILSLKRTMRSGKLLQAHVAKYGGRN